MNLSALYAHVNENEKAFDVLLNVHNFNLENESCLTKMYKSYINKVFSSLCQEYVDFLTSDFTVKKKCIFGGSLQDTNTYFNELKKISWMRKHKKMTYHQIFEEL